VRRTALPDNLLYFTQLLQNFSGLGNFWDRRGNLAPALASILVDHKSCADGDISVTFAVLQAVVAIIGYDSLKHLSRIALPFKILILSFVLFLLATHSDPNFAPASVFHYAGKPEAGWLLFVTWMNVVAAGSLTMVTDSADFCRYTRSRTDMWWGTLLGKVGGGAFAACLGAYAAAATLGKTANVFEVASGLTTSHFVLLLFLVVIALDNWTINVLNLYTGGLSLSNMFERLGRFWTTLIISLLGIVLSAIPDVASGFTTYVGILGNVFSPIAGVLIADYLLVKRGRIDLVALCSSRMAPIGTGRGSTRLRWFGRHWVFSPTCS